MTAAEDAAEALRLAREALAVAEAAARAAGVAVEDRAKDGGVSAERFTLVAPDGGRRLVVTGSSTEIYARGEVVEHPRRTQPGMIFVNQEGTECGGITWDTTGGSLTFDSHEQDQAVALIHDDTDGVRTSSLEFIDRPHSSMVEALLGGHAGEEPGDGPVSRMRLATEADGSVALTFRDAEGRVRLRLGLDEHGQPSVELLGPNGGHAGGIG